MIRLQEHLLDADEATPEEMQRGLAVNKIFTEATQPYLTELHQKIPGKVAVCIVCFTEAGTVFVGNLGAEQIIGMVREYFDHVEAQGINEVELKKPE